MLKRVSIVCSVAAMLAVAAPRAQEPEFEVASVKPNKSGSEIIGIRFPGVGQFNVINMPLREMIRFAYDLQPMQIEGGPDWMSSDRFDIVAKAEGRPTMPQVHAMLRSLLAERFALRTHCRDPRAADLRMVIARAGQAARRTTAAGDRRMPRVRMPNAIAQTPAAAARRSGS